MLQSASAACQPRLWHAAPVYGIQYTTTLCTVLSTYLPESAYIRLLTSFVSREFHFLRNFSFIDVPNVQLHATASRSMLSIGRSSLSLPVALSTFLIFRSTSPPAHVHRQRFEFFLQSLQQPIGIVVRKYKGNVLNVDQSVSACTALHVQCTFYRECSGRRKREKWN